MGILRTDKISGLETPTAATGSVNFPGSDDYITAPANTPELLLNDNDFTIEGWFYKTNTGQQDAFGLYNTASNRRSYLLTVSDSATIFYYNYTGSSGTNVTHSSTLPLNKWVHVAITRDGTTLRIYVDGKLSGTTTGLTAGAYANTDDQFMIGSSDYSNANGSEWTGHISNLRIVKGYVLYGGDFTVPDHALEVVPGTVLLACNNPDSVTAVESALVGKGLTLTAVNDVAVTSVTPGLTRDFTSGTEFKGVTTFDTQGYFVPPSGTTEKRFPDFGAVDAASARGVFAGGYSPGETNIIDYVTISTLGDAQDFGDLTVATEYPAGTSDRTRGLTLGGQTGSSALNTVSFVTIASAGNASDFGDLLNALRQKGALANSTRAIAVGGSPTSGPFAANNVMDYFTIQSSGNGLNFGDLTELTNYGNPTASSVRGVFSGMSDPNGSTTNTISFVTISTTGNAANFGDLDFTGSGGGALSNSTRGVIARDNNTELDFITIASLGNSQDFGTLTGNARYNTDAAVSSSTRGLFMIGAPVGNGINYITIPSTGNGQDFGDLTRSPGGDAGFSNGHGGLG